MSKLWTAGITWTDVGLLLNSLEGIHECNVELIVTTGGQGHNGSVRIGLKAWVPTVEAQQTKVIATLVATWPDRDHPTFDSFVFNSLYALDRRIGLNYAQEEIPE
jgi:hypothetical protein